MLVADRLFGFEVARREWIDVAMAALGLAMLAATLEHGDDAHSAWRTGPLVAIKALSDELDRGLLVLAHPLALLILVLSLVALLVSASSLQTGQAVPVIATTSVSANVSTILAGPLVFAKPVPPDPPGLALRALAFALVIVAAALTPGPVRAAS
jgi:hypothetical protein